ncbi:hypothetical protein E1292_43200 [Nonomuraea deserti]|uniref:PpiC domain-containing protein n=1 Tax=Nonomuraea deserti TaxID=1848322 RepID=A0A4R4UGL0_9ACTN|nr:hypothetical protein [Nonomuraea deserti]TDC90917.1 hypothetical protein E1292_43200 [Nonomuraea deserti]
MKTSAKKPPARQGTGKGTAKATQKGTQRGTQKGTAKGSGSRRGVTRVAARRPSRRAAVLFAGVCAVLAALLLTGAVLSQRGGEVASVDGHAVTRDELLFHMRRLAPSVQNELRNRYHLQGAVDWNARAGDRSALQRLTARALDEIERDKTALILAKEQGLIDSVDHAGFLAELAAENERRAEAVTRGEVVYGLREFSPDEYYSHRLTELTTRLEQRLSTVAGGPLQVTDADVRRAFDADPDAWSANATTYAYAKLVVPVPDGASAGYLAGLQRRVDAADRLADLAGREPGARLTKATHQGGGSAAHEQDLMAVLGELAPGGISAPVEGGGQVTYYELTSRSVDEDAAFAEYARRIRQSLIEKKFGAYLQRRVDDRGITVDTAAVDAINAEDVHSET